MRSPKASAHNEGFSLVEVLIVTALTAFVAGFGLVISMDVYRQTLLHGELRTLVGSLEKTRSRAMHNMHGSTHGLHIESTGYTLFRGNAYNANDPTNEFIPQSSSVSLSGATDIVFRQLTGDSSFAGTLTLSDGTRSHIISINYEGRINW